MSNGGTFYEEARDLGETISNGLRYRVFFDPRRQRSVCVLIPGQDRPIGPLKPIEPA